ncbi:EH domain-containing protein 1 [Sesamum angolense]|uniref:EH domain-containing protein 1 n=1 Tax=Sesamum angolense TaxID=2727404 RepID=A0AAE2BIS3_9LAMI|nr:EH domain-containing protein 1 [Sesamum angolense]
MVVQLRGTRIPFLGNVIVSNTVACILELCSWFYRTVVFYLVCVLFRLICYLQILRLQDFAQVFQVDSDVESVLREHLRIRRHLRIISHRYRSFILFALIFITASQFASLLMTTRSSADVNIYHTGELAVCSLSLLAGLLILLRSATRITHKAQAVTCLAAKWHVCATIDSFDTAETETPVARVSDEQIFTASSDGSSDLDDVGDEEDELDNSKFLPAYAFSTISFQKRQALVTYFENNRAGITIYGFMLDRTSLHTIFGIELSLVLWLLGKTRSWRRLCVSMERVEQMHSFISFCVIPCIDVYAFSLIPLLPTYVLLLKGIPTGGETTDGTAKSEEQHFLLQSDNILPMQSYNYDWRAPEDLSDLVAFVDSDGDGRLTANDASKFFSMSNLPRPDLKQMWAIADSKRQGFLEFKEFVLAMQLVSLAQAGHTLTKDILNTEVDFENLPPPAMEGLDKLLAKKKRLSEPENGSQRQSSSSVNLFHSSKSAKMSGASVTSIIDGLKRLYVKKLKPLEDTYQFNNFVSPSLTNSDFDAKPMVMLLGQYSTGKTTFIKHLLGTSYPGANIGPEPTTDRFVVVMNGADERSVPGNTVAVQADMPFNGLTTFGSAFLSKFECSQMPHPLLENITFVDTPGVLSGEKQRTQRSYDFTGVTSWFASKCDLILLLFDPHKLDISDEFKRVIESLRGHDDKIRVVLNKADQIDTQQLMRVYGALMWSLGKVLNTPEVMRVYIGSFNDKPIREGVSGPMGKELFEKEQEDLLSDLKDIPKKACDRRINEFVKRARAAKIHAYIIGHLRNEMPTMIGKAKTQKRLLDDLGDEFAKVQREHHLPAGDFPDVEQFRELLTGYSIDRFERLKPKMIQSVDDMLAHDIPQLLQKFRNPYD